LVDEYLRTTHGKAGRIRGSLLNRLQKCRGERSLQVDFTGVFEGEKVRQFHRAGKIVGHAAIVRDPRMRSSRDKASLVLVRLQGGDADDHHVLVILRGVRKDDPQVPIQFREEGEPRLHGSLPEQLVEKAAVRLVLFDGRGQLAFVPRDAEALRALTRAQDGRYRRDDRAKDAVAVNVTDG